MAKLSPSIRRNWPASAQQGCAISPLQLQDFVSRLTSDTGAVSGGSRQQKINVHGVINVVSWGILIPVGAMLARYLKVFKAANPAWFYLYVACQVSGYAVGVAGCGTGLKPGSDSPGVRQDTHRNIEITLFPIVVQIIIYSRKKS